MSSGEDKGECISFQFRQGLLNIVDQEELIAHGARSTLFYGRTECMHENYWPQGLYILPLEHLKKIKNVGFFAWGYVPLNEYTTAKRTITGGLKIRRVNNYSRRSIREAKFSRKEWQTIEKYL